MTALPLESGPWVGVPLSAIAVGVAIAGPLGRAAVSELFETAHISGYDEREWTEQGLSTVWGLSRGVCVQLLKALERRGHLEVERSAPRSRRPSRLRVWPACQRTREQLRALINQSRNQYDQPGTPKTENRQPDGEPPRGSPSPAPQVGDRDRDRSILPQPPPERAGAPELEVGPPPPPPPAEPRRERRRTRSSDPPVELAHVAAIVRQVLEGAPAATWAQAARGDPGLAEAVRRAAKKGRLLPRTLRRGRDFELALIEAARLRALELGDGGLDPPPTAAWDTLDEDSRSALRHRATAELGDLVSLVDGPLREALIEEGARDMWRSADRRMGAA